MKHLSVLILEDDLETLSVIFKTLHQLEEMAEFYPIVLSTYEQVEKLINQANLQFDLILLDRDCAMGGSFHILNIEKFGIDKVIGISSVPEYNSDIVKRGVKVTIHKEYENLKLFESKLFNELQLFIEHIKAPQVV